MQNQNNPLVSVIIPFFNSETYLQETIESVLYQTYTDWEILLVDDGSTDKSTEIALDYHSRYPDWDFYRKHKNSLSYVALEKGKKASCELFYLKWLEKHLVERGIGDNDLWKALRERKWKYTHLVLFKLRTYRYRLLYKLKDMVIATARLILPQSIFSNLFKRLRNHEYVPPTGRVRFGDMRRLSPFSAHWGRERGLPIDRHYIENFIASNSHYVKGRILEFGDDRYTMEYYNEKITTADIINLNEDANPKSTIIADIVNAPHIPSGTYDCIIFTQTLQSDLRGGVFVRTRGERADV